jgi:hypothetical protein
MGSDFEVDAAPAKRPRRAVLEGRYVTLAPLEPSLHGDALWEATKGEQNDALWRYLAEGPFRHREDFDKALAAMAASKDPLFFAIVDSATHRAIGRASYLTNRYPASRDRSRRTPFLARAAENARSDRSDVSHGAARFRGPGIQAL